MVKKSVLVVYFLLLLQIVTEVNGAITFIPNQPYSPTFNFHNKTAFLKDNIKKLVECIQANATGVKLNTSETLHKSTKGSENGEERFVFEYIGSRLYNESCLGDTYKRDFIRRLYDAVCVTYEEKVKFLDLLSCNASQNLECRQTGVEPIREFAEQATPVMHCLCPDYNKSQAYLSDKSRGYYDFGRKECVLKTGQLCTVNPKPLDKRLEWNDFDYDDNEDTNSTAQGDGIDVVDLRPIAVTYPCVNHSFCYTHDKRGLQIPEINKYRCVCEAGYFEGTDRECHPRESPSARGIFLATIMFSIGVLSFIFGFVM